MINPDVLPALRIVCDRCRRRVATVSGYQGSSTVYVDAFMEVHGTDRDTLGWEPGPGNPAGGIKVPAQRSGWSFRQRYKLMCIGRKHPNTVRTIKAETMEAVYAAAVSAGIKWIYLSEVSLDAPRFRFARLQPRADPRTSNDDSGDA